MLTWRSNADGKEEAEAPTPGASYRPFIPPESPAPAYVDFGQYDSMISVASEREDGIFLSAEEVLALKQFAQDRDALQERLAKMEQEAAERDAEVATLRAQLDRPVATGGDASGNPRALEEMAASLFDEIEEERKPVGTENMRRLPLKAVSAGAPRRSDRDLNTMATQRQQEAVAKREAQNAVLREQWRQLRSARAVRAGLPVPTGSEAPLPEVQ